MEGGTVRTTTLNPETMNRYELEELCDWLNDRCNLIRAMHEIPEPLVDDVEASVIFWGDDYVKHCRAYDADDDVGIDDNGNIYVSTHHSLDQIVDYVVERWQDECPVSGIEYDYANREFVLTETETA